MHISNCVLCVFVILRLLLTGHFALKIQAAYHLLAPGCSLVSLIDSPPLFSACRKYRHINSHSFTFGDQRTECEVNSGKMSRLNKNQEY